MLHFFSLKNRSTAISVYLICLYYKNQTLKYLDINTTYFSKKESIFLEKINNKLPTAHLNITKSPLPAETCFKDAISNNERILVFNFT